MYTTGGMLRSDDRLRIGLDTSVRTVGAGIASLTLANSLTRRGIRHVIVEVASALQPQGLGYDGARILHERGVT